MITYINLILEHNDYHLRPYFSIEQSELELDEDGDQFKLTVELGFISDVYYLELVFLPEVRGTKL